MRRRIVAANWKMNGSEALAKELVGNIIAQLEPLDKSVEIVIMPPALYVRDVQQQLGESGFRLGVQNIARWDEGAYTGEISAGMAADMGADYALVGHSERRSHFAEGNGLIAEKVDRALMHGITAVLCVGETLEEREAGLAKAIVYEQVEQALSDVVGEGWKNIVVAYEPVWAIGTGKTATADDAQQMHQAIRELLEKLGAPADRIPLLYGGSVKPDNAAELFAQPDIDGGLIGGASLKAEDFVRICQAI
ncbi:triose-phosphate isomerase [Marinobacter sp.]|uniref:triose-phosphate isomerase n=1 Tax=Marinobacter sp. TaxID=50741 RepID=UPI003850193C